MQSPYKESDWMFDTDEQHAISAVLDGDMNAYALLVERYQRPIFNLMYRMTGSSEDAADLAQETFVRAYEQLYRFRNGSKFFPWLYTIGLNHCRNHLRSRNGAKTVPVDECDLGSGLDYNGQQEDNICTRLDSQRIDKALRELPLDYREALILRYHEDLPLEDTASALNLSLSAAKMRVHRGLKKLREILERGTNGR